VTRHAFVLVKDGDFAVGFNAAGVSNSQHSGSKGRATGDGDAAVAPGDSIGRQSGIASDALAPCFGASFPPKTGVHFSARRVMLAP
jgi:hypothetical protein